jgi:hypothetical protein
LRHSRSHQVIQQETSEKSATKQQHAPLLSQTVPTSLPDSGSMDWIDVSSTLETAIGEGISNQSPSSAAGPSASDPAFTSFSMDRMRQCDELPYWDFDDDPQGSFFDSLLNNNMNLGDLNTSLLNTMTVESRLEMTGGHEPRNMPLNMPSTVETFTLDGRKSCERESVIQQSWHTYCSNSSSGLATPDLGHDQCALDEDYHRDLVDEMQPQLQLGTLPSASFLVGNPSVSSSNLLFANLPTGSLHASVFLSLSSIISNHPRSNV